MSKYLLIFFYVALHSFCSFSSENYDMADLRALTKERNYNEFFKHALDIRPSTRSQEWKDMVEEQGLNLLSDLLKKLKMEKTDYKLVHRISNWPIFKENEFFIKKRDFIFLKELETCFTASDNTTCLKKADIIYHDYEHDPIFSFDLSSKLHSLGVSNLQLWKYAKKLAKNPLSEYYCHKAPFSEIVLDRLFLVNNNGKNKDKFSIHADCLKTLRPIILKSMTSQNLKSRKYAFNYLKQNMPIKEYDLYEYHSLNFIMAQDMSLDEIDSSLKALKYYRNNYGQRDKFLKKLKSIDPLPGKIFSHLDSKKNKAKLRTLNRYLPEYIIQYSKTCLNYLKGEKSFKNGNPTPHCHSLYKSKEARNILPKHHSAEYDKATFFLK